MRKRVDRFKGSRTQGGCMIKRLPRRQWFPKAPGEKPFNRWLSQNPFQISIQRWTLRDSFRPKERRVLYVLLDSPLVISEILWVQGCAFLPFQC